jgi:hypothetical protein
MVVVRPEADRPLPGHQAELRAATAALMAAQGALEAAQSRFDRLSGPARELRSCSVARSSRVRVTRQSAPRRSRAAGGEEILRRGGRGAGSAKAVDWQQLYYAGRQQIIGDPRFTTGPRR